VIHCEFPYILLIPLLLLLLLLCCSYHRPGPVMCIDSLIILKRRILCIFYDFVDGDWHIARFVPMHDTTQETNGHNTATELELAIPDFEHSKTLLRPATLTLPNCWRMFPSIVKSLLSTCVVLLNGKYPVSDYNPIWVPNFSVIRFLRNT
jgi:hypothetical protein